MRMRHTHIVVDFHARRIFLGSPLQQGQCFPRSALLQQPEPLGALPTMLARLLTLPVSRRYRRLPTTR